MISTSLFCSNSTLPPLLLLVFFSPLISVKLQFFLFFVYYFQMKFSIFSTKRPFCTSIFTIGFLFLFFINYCYYFNILCFSRSSINKMTYIRSISTVLAVRSVLEERKNNICNDCDVQRSCLFLYYFQKKLNQCIVSCRFLFYRLGPPQLFSAISLLYHFCYYYISYA